jgi:hypothetical protein
LETARVERDARIEVLTGVDQVLTLIPHGCGVAGRADRERAHGGSRCHDGTASLVAQPAMCVKVGK